MVWYLFTSGTTETWAWRDVGGVEAASWISGKESLILKIWSLRAARFYPAGKSRQGKGESPKGVRRPGFQLSSAKNSPGAQPSTSLSLGFFTKWARHRLDAERPTGNTLLPAARCPPASRGFPALTLRAWVSCSQFLPLQRLFRCLEGSNRSTEGLSETSLVQARAAPTQLQGTPSPHRNKQLCSHNRPCKSWQPHTPGIPCPG